MSDAEKRILQNQVEIMWTLHYILGKLVPDLVGRNGELDKFRADLVASSKDTNRLLDSL
jgi:hypothetical protein